MGYSGSAATATSNPLAFGAPTYINFGAGYIEAPLSQTQTPTADATAATGSPGAGNGISYGGEGTVAGMTPTQLLIVGGLGAVIFLAAVFLITHKQA